MKRNIVVGAISLLVLAGVVLYVQRSVTSKDDNKDAPTKTGIYSFEECVAAGNPVMESYPRQCSAGKITFVETVQEQPNADAVVFENIQAGQLVTGPLEVRGKALGTWFFEANIGLRLLDGNGKEVVRGHAEAGSDWMTTELVPFKGTLMFGAPATQTGFIEIQKDNPSGLPENDGSARVPVRFR